MSQIKLAAILLMPLAFSCSIATAQEQPQDCAVNSASASQPNSPVASKSDEVYGAYVPYTASPVRSPAGCVSRVLTAGNTPNAQTTSSSLRQTPSTKTQSRPEEVYGAFVPYVAPANKVPPPQSETAEVKTISPAVSESAKVPPTVCGPVEYKVDEVYGRYVPYTGPAKPPTACYTPSDQVARSIPPPPPNASVRQGHSPEVMAKSLVSSQLEPIPPMSADVALAIAPEPPAGDPSGGEGFIRTIPVPIPVTPPKEIPPDRPFRNVIIGFKGNTLGAGIEIATPVSRTLYLRSSFNMLAFDYPFNIHGVDYDARLHFKSSGTTLDWYPSHHSFRISPGILYVKNTLDAPASVGPGQVFKLSTQSFINSVDDPVSGYASVVYPHTIAPMVLFGFRNTIPGTSGHLSIPIEFGAAYTGAPKINVALDGTACTTMGCFSFDTNADAQKFLKQEVQNLNDDLKYFPVYPILSIGFAYHF